MEKIRILRIFTLTFAFHFLFLSSCSHVHNFSKRNRARKIAKRQIKLICSIYERESTKQIREAYKDLANCKDYMSYVIRNQEKEHLHLYTVLMRVLRPPFKSEQQEKLYQAIEATYDIETESFSLDSNLQEVYDEVYGDLCDECSFRSNEEKSQIFHHQQAYRPSDAPSSRYLPSSHQTSAPVYGGVCDINNYKQKKPNLQGCQLAHGKLFAVDFEGVHLDNSNLKGANLENAHLAKSFLLDAHLEDANIHGANLGGADLSRANLVRAKLQYVKMSDAKLRQADLSSADLKHARLDKVDARGATFKSTILISAKMRHANFENVSFIGADLTGADVEGASFKGANLSNAKLDMVKGMVESCPEEMPDSYECDKDKKNSFVKD